MFDTWSATLVEAIVLNHKTARRSIL